MKREKEKNKVAGEIWGNCLETLRVTGMLLSF